MARKRPIDRVLVIARGPIASFVSALPAMHRIREAHPQARITLLTTTPFDTLARACPYFDLVDATGEAEDFSEWRELAGRLRATRFDRIYDLENSAWTGRLFQHLWPFPPAWSGTALGCRLPHRNPLRDDMHPVERHADQLKAAGVWAEVDTRPGSAPSPDASWIRRRYLEPRRGPKRILLLAPGDITDPPEGRWLAQAYGDVAVTMHSEGYDVVIIGEHDDAPLAQAIQRFAPARDLTPRPDYAQIAALGARAVLAIGADTGIMSLVIAAGAPCLILQAAEAPSPRPASRGHVTALCAERLAGLAVADVLRATGHLMPALQKSM